MLIIIRELKNLGLSVQQLRAEGLLASRLLHMSAASQPAVKVHHTAVRQPGLAFAHLQLKSFKALGYHEVLLTPCSRELASSPGQRAEGRVSDNRGKGRAAKGVREFHQVWSFITRVPLPRAMLIASFCTSASSPSFSHSSSSHHYQQVHPSSVTQNFPTSVTPKPSQL